ncbi:MAG: hypothetical protein AAF684_07925 [Pseudomonadota bacterium]
MRSALVYPFVLALLPSLSLAQADTALGGLYVTGALAFSHYPQLEADANGTFRDTAGNTASAAAGRRSSSTIST